MPRIQAGPRQLRATFAEDERLPYRRIAPAPLSPTIGAEIGGIALAEAMDDETFAEVHRALLEFESSSSATRTSPRSSTSPSRAASATWRRTRSCPTATDFPR
jgi:hypothetical protein